MTVPSVSAVSLSCVSERCVMRQCVHHNFLCQKSLCLSQVCKTFCQPNIHISLIIHFKQALENKRNLTNTRIMDEMEQNQVLQEKMLNE